MLIIKISHGDDIRRITFPAIPTVAELRNVVQERFNLQNEFNIKYFDEDDDLITISSNYDLQEAITVFVQGDKSRQLLRLYVQKPGDNAEFLKQTVGASFFVNGSFAPVHASQNQLRHPDNNISAHVPRPVESKPLTAFAGNNNNNNNNNNNPGNVYGSGNNLNSIPNAGNPHIGNQQPENPQPTTWNNQPNISQAGIQSGLQFGIPSSSVNPQPGGPQLGVNPRNPHGNQFGANVGLNTGNQFNNPSNIGPNAGNPQPGNSQLKSFGIQPNGNPQPVNQFSVQPNQPVNPPHGNQFGVNIGPNTGNPQPVMQFGIPSSSVNPQPGSPQLGVNPRNPHGNQFGVNIGPNTGNQFNNPSNIGPNAGNPQPGHNFDSQNLNVNSPQTGKHQPGKQQPGKQQPGNPQPINPQLGNPQPSNPQLSNPQLSNPQLSNPQLGNPQPGNPQPANPQPGNPQPAIPIVNPQDIGPAHDKEPYASRFVADVGAGDMCEFGPGEEFEKIWLMKNIGTKPWPKGTTLEWTAGDKITTIATIHAPEAQPDQEAQVKIKLKAPNVPGRYVSYYRMVLPNGSVKFGNRIWADIVVKDKPATKYPDEYLANLRYLSDMGFNNHIAYPELRKHNNNVEDALCSLLQ